MNVLVGRPGRPITGPGGRPVTFRRTRRITDTPQLNRWEAPLCRKSHHAPACEALAHKGNDSARQEMPGAANSGVPPLNPVGGNGERGRATLIISNRILHSNHFKQGLSARRRRRSPRPEAGTTSGDQRLSSTGQWSPKALLAIVSGHKAMLDSRQTKRRLEAAVPHATVRPLSRIGHRLPDQSDVIAELLRDSSVVVPDG